ncbi:MAG: sugar ABC transporter substrate-binding protein [Candidatus Gastranaerophilales bacterium]|nr:sugar ABC transporter substrate-binding protein [Candidatus Gastranaerophilales bacterium]
MFKKLICSICLLLLIFGCIPKPKENRIELEFWTLQLNGFSDYINHLINEYETAHPDIKIKWVDIPFSEGEKRILASVMSKNVPDVVNMNPSFSSVLASRGALLDLNGYIDENTFNSYVPQSFEYLTYDKKIFGIPWYITSAVTIYNEDIFEKSDIDKIPQTYNDLAKIAPKIKEKTNKYVFMPNLTEDGMMIKIFNKYQIPIVNKEKTEALFDTPEAADILEFWKNMYNKNYIPKESITQTHRDSLEKYQSGQTAVILAGANFLKIIKENAPEIYKNSNVSSQLTGNNNKVDFSLMNLIIPLKSKHPKEAVEFALYITNEANQLEFYKLAPILPSTKKSLNDELFSKKNNLFEKGRSISAMQLKNAISPIPRLTKQKELYETIDYMTQEVLLNKKTPQISLKETKEKWDDILKGTD